jgi:hypothetical protein
MHCSAGAQVCGNASALKCKVVWKLALLALKMETAVSGEMLVPVHQAVWRQTQEDCNAQCVLTLFASGSRRRD